MTDSKLLIPIILGTSRPGRRSERVATYMLRYVEEHLSDRVQTQIIDPKEYDTPLEGRDEKDPKYNELVAKADGFFIISPEYNHGYPGSLKRLLDSALKEYIHKPVALCGVSNGPWGGARVIEALVNVVRELGLVVTFNDVNISHVSKVLSEDGEPQDGFHAQPVESSWKELVWMAQVLKWGRENVKQDTE